MICPECGSEYREGYVRCGSCDVALVHETAETRWAPGPPEPSRPQVALVKVFETGNAALVPLFESLLDDAGIEYLVKGDQLQHLFGIVHFGTSPNSAMALAEYWVREDQAAEARAIAEALEREVPPEPYGLS